MNYEYISLRSILEDFIDLANKNEEVDESFILKCASDAANRIIPASAMVEQVALLEVENYVAPLPENHRYVIQAAYRLNKDGVNKHTLVEEVVQHTYDLLDGSGCELKVNLDCPRCKQPSCDCSLPMIEVDVNRIWETANPQLYAHYMGHFSGHGNLTARGSSSYHNDFKLMNHTANSFFNVPYHVNECPNINFDSDIEYNIVAPNMITNFKCGHVLLAYLGHPIDQDGYRMIPNSELVFKAIQFYIQERLALKGYLQAPGQGTRVLWMDMDSATERAIGRARAQLTNPSIAEFTQFVKSHWVKLIPNWDWEKNTNRTSRNTFRLPNETYNTDGGSIRRKR